jgi:hypothetical protein
MGGVNWLKNFICMYENKIMKPIRGVNFIKAHYMHAWKHHNETPLYSYYMLIRNKSPSLTSPAPSFSSNIVVKWPKPCMHIWIIKKKVKKKPKKEKPLSCVCIPCYALWDWGLHLLPTASSSMRTAPGASVPSVNVCRWMCALSEIVSVGVLCKMHRAPQTWIPWSLGFLLCSCLLS